MRRAGLHSRLARLEKRYGERPALPLVTFLIYGRQPTDILDYRILAPGRVRAAIYKPRERQSGPLPLPDPASALSGLPSAPSNDPWALAGIGRGATWAELVKAGAIRVAPERLI